MSTLDVEYDFKREFNNLIDISPSRWMTLVDIIQEVAVYLILAIFFGLLVEKIFFPEELTLPQRINRPTWQIIILIFFQLALDAIVIYYLVMIARLVPLAFNRNLSVSTTYVSLRAAFVISFVFIGLQASLLARLNELSRRLKF